MNTPCLNGFVKLFLVLPFLFSRLLIAEGTLELRPSEDQFGSLYISKHVKFTSFGQYGAPEENQLKLNIKAVGETVYFGLNNKEQGGGFVNNVPFRIVSPSGVVAYTSEIPDTGEEGNIDNWDEAAAGPIELGNAGGYDAIAFNPNEIGDYVIEFDPFSVAGNNVELFIHLFDFTVVGTDGLVKAGRLHSKGWQLTSEGSSNELSSVVYPYGLNGVVYKVAFQKMKPYTFVINFNAKGIQNTGNFLEDRKSVETRNYYPEFEVFLNAPDATIYPTNIKNVHLESIIENTDCQTSTFCLNFSSDAEGLLEGYVDVNGNNVLDTINGDVYFSYFFEQPDTICIPWDGKDKDGNLVTDTEIEVISSFGYGVMHLPLVDVEDNPNGYKVDLVRPSSLPAPLLFWDDSELTKGTATQGGLMELAGCNATVNGCHGWTGRGNSGSEETVNTWWYSNLIEDVIKFDPRPKTPVQLSYDPNNLHHSDTTLCKDDVLQLHVFNDGISHYDAALYDYTWFVAGTSQASQVASLTLNVDSTVEVVISALEHEFACEYFDTILVTAQAKYVVDSAITQATCVQGGAIKVTVLEGPANPTYHWTGTTENSDSIYNLSPGLYPLTLIDSAFSANCMLQTSFRLNEVDSLQLSQINTTPSFCYTPSGTAQIIYSGAATVAYSWNNQPFSPQSTQTNLAAGNYKVVAQNVQNFCKDSISFTVSELPLTVNYVVNNANCANTDGSIEVTPPPGATFTYTYNHVPGNSVNSHLSQGNYWVHVSAAHNASCTTDSLVVVGINPSTLTIKDLQISASHCDHATGTAQVNIRKPATENYLFLWDGGTAALNDSIKDHLTVGTHTVTITETNGLCGVDTTFEITGTGLNYLVDITNSVCGSPNGHIKVTPNNAAATISWQNGTTNLERNHLHAGSYTFTVSIPNTTGCSKTETLFLSDSSYQFDFNTSIQTHSNAAFIAAGDAVTFESSLLDAQDFSWQFGDGNSSSLASPTHQFQYPGTYTYSLTAIDKNGCVASKTLDITINEQPPCTAVVPRAFSPNEDGINDQLTVMGDYHAIDLQIYNRWGEPVFRSFNQTDKWDGYYRGVPAISGVYPYVLEVQCLNYDGSISSSTQIGDVSLIR